MKLRFLRISNFPPFKDIEINFGIDRQQDLFTHKNFLCCATGQNGIGKTRLLEALALALFRLRKYKLPKFSITMTYDLEINGNKQTIYFTHSPETQTESSTPYNTQLVVFKGLQESVIKCYGLRLSDDAPATEKVYRGEAFFQDKVLNTYLPKVVVYTNAVRNSWDKLVALADGIQISHSSLITQADLKLAVCALVLSKKNSNGFNTILEMLGINPVIEITNKAGNTLLERIKSEHSINNQTALELFNQLRNTNWKVFNDYLEVSLSKKSGLVSYDWLSEGEQSLLGQAALFSLLENNTNTLILLDEPEKAFDENGKQLLVKLLYDNLGQTNCTIIFSSKSSVVLTDLFDWQIIILKKIESGNFFRVTARNPVTKTFAASTTDIVTNIFNCSESVGEFSHNYLEDVLSSLDNFEPTELSNLITKLEAVEGILGGGYYQLEFRRRLKALKKFVA